jgi:hypothetical protein
MPAKQAFRFLVSGCYRSVYGRFCCSLFSPPLAAFFAAYARKAGI